MDGSKFDGSKIDDGEIDSGEFDDKIEKKGQKTSQSKKLFESKKNVRIGCLELG